MANTVNIHFMLLLLFLTPSPLRLRLYHNPKNEIKKFETSCARSQFTFQNLPPIAVIQAVGCTVPNPKYKPSFDMGFRCRYKSEIKTKEFKRHLCQLSVYPYGTS